MHYLINPLKGILFRLRSRSAWPRAIGVLLFYEDDLTGVEANVLDGIVELTEVLVGGGRVLVPQARLCLRADVEKPTHLFIDIPCNTIK